MGQQLALYQGVEEVAAPPRASGGQGVLSGTQGNVLSGNIRRYALSGGTQGNALPGTKVRMCAACQDKEARYGFRDAPPPQRFGASGAAVGGRPRTLCFECFRTEIGRRQAVAARIARGWNGTQVSLPLAETLDRLDRRRRHAQIAARRTLELR